MKRKERQEKNTNLKLYIVCFPQKIEMHTDMEQQEFSFFG